MVFEGSVAKLLLDTTRLSRPVKSQHLDPSGLVLRWDIVLEGSVAKLLLGTARLTRPVKSQHLDPSGLVLRWDIVLEECSCLLQWTQMD